MNGNVLRRLLTGLTLLALAFPGWAARPTQAVVLATAPFAVQSVPRGTISMQSASAIATGWRHTCLLTGNGGVECWGYNFSGQLGDGTTLNRGTPAFVAGLASNVAAVDGGSGSAHTCAVTSAGGVKCWGFNTFGQLGDGTTADRLTPVDVSGLANEVTAIAVGDQHTCALTVGGGVKCWGRNSRGQLGNGSTEDSTTPMDVNGLTSGVIAIAAGHEHTCALTNGGGVKCWGGNYFGQLGTGSIAQHPTPVDVSGLTSGVIGITAGYAHTCAVTNGGGAKCWGYNATGQLGDGTTTQRNTPTDPSGLTSAVAAITAGGYQGHTCTLISGGRVKCWGDNSSGQLGDGTTTQRSTPTDVTGMASGVTAISAGGSHTCALISGGVKCWGSNSFGQLGDGTTTPSSTPVDVIGFYPPVSASVSPSGGELISSVDDTIYSFSAGVFTEAVVITHTYLSSEDIPTTVNLIDISHNFQVTAVYSSTGQPAQPTQPYTLTIQYTDAEKGPAIESTLALYYWDGAQWVQEPTSVLDGAANTITATPNHFSFWAVLGQTQRLFLPLIQR